QYAHRAVSVTWVCLRNLMEMLWARLRGRPDLPGPERLRLLLEELGGSFLKFGQILSVQVDALPREYCNALMNLLDRVPPFRKEQVRQVFLEELGKPPEELYREFDYQPIASASIGQAHRALLPDATVVAVKVQRPGIQELFRRDAVLLQAFVRVAFLLRIRSLYFLRDPVREFRDWLEDELDYRREAAYAQGLGRNAAGNPAERVPKIYWELTTARVLTMDYLEGVSISQYLRLKEQGDEAALRQLDALGFVPATFVSNVINNFMSDAFRYGLFHADLHPANLLILKDNVVGYVDFGIVGHLTPEARRKQIQLSMAYARGNTDEIFEAFLDTCLFTSSVDVAGFRKELEKRCQSWYRQPAIGGIPQLQRSLTVAMVDLLSLCRNYGLLVDREMIKYIRSLFLADGLISLLSPGLDLTPQIRKVCEDYLAREARNKILSRHAVMRFLADLSGWLSANPAQMLRAMHLIERDQARSRPPSGGAEPDESLRVRAAAVGAVWLALVLAGFAGRESVSLATNPFGSYFFVAFTAGWTLWLAALLRRLAAS
ncbi:MAG TPA: AarF/UbiB family protein, partial [Terriglobia bacterium]|nr:AarF/UbiB family protein [Terriglobia bacterium]